MPYYVCGDEARVLYLDTDPLSVRCSDADDAVPTLAGTKNRKKKKKRRGSRGAHKQKPEKVGAPAEAVKGRHWKGRAVQTAWGPNMLRRAALGALRGRAPDGASLWSAIVPEVYGEAAAALHGARAPEGSALGNFSAAALKDALEGLVKSNRRNLSNSSGNWMNKGVSRSEGILDQFVSHSRQCMRMVGSHDSSQLNKVHGRHYTAPCSIRALSSTSSSRSSERTTHEESKKDLATSEDPFDAPTYNIPEKPVTFAEGASYSVAILLGLGVAAAAAYAVFKELVFEPKEYKIFGKALERVQNDSQVRVRIGSPVTGYGQESRNRAARQRIPHKTWTDEDGVEHVEVNFYVRGPHGGGKVYSEMFKDKVDKQWKFTYLIVDIMSPSQARLMLESYIPA